MTPRWILIKFSKNVCNDIRNSGLENITTEPIMIFECFMVEESNKVRSQHRAMFWSAVILDPNGSGCGSSSLTRGSYFQVAAALRHHSFVPVSKQLLWGKLESCQLENRDDPSVTNRTPVPTCQQPEPEAATAWGGGGSGSGSPLDICSSGFCAFLWSECSVWTRSRFRPSRWSDGDRATGWENHPSSAFPSLKSESCFTAGGAVAAKQYMSLQIQHNHKYWFP